MYAYVIQRHNFSDCSSQAISSRAVMTSTLAPFFSISFRISPTLSSQLRPVREGEGRGS